MNLLIDVVRHRWRDRQDFFTGGNMFVYYSMNQVRNRDYKGPDFFVVKDIDGSFPRQKWVVWEEDASFPNVIVELMSESTKDEDLGPKKKLYERTFKMPDYFCYDPDGRQLYGWHLEGQRYAPLEADENGRLIPTEAEAEREKAEAESQRADKAEAELEQLRIELARLRGEEE
ncbi:MAG: Uma2 family endonuclease [Chloroflexi bacterium]|nr:Uma2 family endonuclease [Chloroflexota bacterium]